MRLMPRCPKRLWVAATMSRRAAGAGHTLEAPLTMSRSSWVPSHR